MTFKARTQKTKRSPVTHKLLNYWVFRANWFSYEVILLENWKHCILDHVFCRCRPREPFSNSKSGKSRTHSQDKPCLPPKAWTKQLREDSSCLSCVTNQGEETCLYSCLVSILGVAMGSGLQHGIVEILWHKGYGAGYRVNPILRLTFVFFSLWDVSWLSRLLYPDLIRSGLFSFCSFKL